MWFNSPTSGAGVPTSSPIDGECSGETGMVLILMDMIVRVSVVMWMIVPLHMGMDRTFGSAKQASGLMGREVRNDLRPRNEVIGNSTKGVRLHHRGHNFFVHREGNKHAIPFDDSRPMLVAQSVA